MPFGIGAADAKTTIFYVNLGGGLANVGSFRYAWRAKKDAYDNIGAGLGVVKAKDTDKNLIFGANHPKPAKVRINFDTAKGTRSTLRWCEPDKLNNVVVGGAINSKKIKVNGNEYNINSVEIA